MTGKTTLNAPWPALLAVAAITMAYGQDATRPGTPSANPPSGSTSTAAPGASDKPTAGTGSEATTTAGGTGKPPPVCFKLTGRCVDQAKAPPPKGGTAHDTSPGVSTTKRPLNLAAPDVRSVVPAEELKEPLPNGEQVTEVQETQTVSVKGDKDAPDVPGGFGAIWWAINHPSQAWRILAPAE